MASGIEMMISSLMRFAGIDPEEMKRSATILVPKLIQATQEFEELMGRMRRLQDSDLPGMEARIVSAINGDLPEMPDMAFAVRDAIPQPKIVGRIIEHGD